MTDATNNYSKWWWLRLDQMVNWSADEWRAFAAFVITWTLMVAMLALLARLKLQSAPWLGGFLLILPLSFTGLRDIAAGLFSKTITKGDDAAAARLGGRVYLPTNGSWVRATWWIDTHAYSSGTEAQKRARRRMLGISFLILIPAFISFALLLERFGVGERLAAVVSLTATIIPAFYAGRRICVMSWPMLIDEADNDAIAAENDLVPPRT